MYVPSSEEKVAVAANMRPINNFGSVSKNPAASTNFVTLRNGRKRRDKKKVRPDSGRLHTGARTFG
jgi:hypothetical protein